MNALGKEFFYALQKMLPEDAKRYPESSFMDAAEHAAMLRETKPWCEKYPKDVFLQYVACPRVNDEDLSFGHRDFYGALSPLIADIPTQDACTFADEAARRINLWCASHARYAPTDERTASPRTVYRSGFGRCGELSTFVVAALRSVGIAARQVYVPKWSHTDDNHAWVEYLAGWDWRYFGACEPRPASNMGWFNGIASQAVLVRSKAFGKATSKVHGELLYQEGNIRYFNQIERYCPEAKELSIRVMKGSRPVSGAKVRLQVLNEGAFCTIATLTADDLGRVSFRTGTGTVRYTACEGGLEATVDSDSKGEIVLQLHPPASQDNGWSSVRVFRPAPMTTDPERYWLQSELDWLAETQEKTAAALNAHVAELTDPSEDGAVPASCRDLLDAARGNRSELIAFLSGDRPDLRERLLRTLTEKDLRDTPCGVLESHFSALPPQGDLPDDVYWPYLACPRLHLEKLIPWRDPDETRNGTAFLSPDEQDLAYLRLRGIPARLRPLDGLLERWKNGAFRLERLSFTATLNIEAEEGPIPDNLWSISRVEADGSMKRLNPAESLWTGGVRSFSLVTGRYHLVSSARAGDGSLFFQERDLFLSPQQTVRVSLAPIRLHAVHLIQHVEMPAVWGKDELLGEEYSLFQAGEPTLLLWVRHRDEPAVHLLEELKRQGRQLADDFETIFVMLDQRDPDYTRLRTELQAALPTAEFLQTAFDFRVEQVARLLHVNPGTYPLLVLGNGCGDAYFAQAGYAVGSLETLLPQVMDCIRRSGWDPSRHLQDEVINSEADLEALRKKDTEDLATLFGGLANYFSDLLDDDQGPTDYGDPEAAYVRMCEREARERRQKAEQPRVGCGNPEEEYVRMCEKELKERLESKQTAMDDEAPEPAYVHLLEKAEQEDQEDVPDLLDWDEFADLIEEHGEPLDGEDEEATLRRVLSLYFDRHPEHLRDFDAQMEEIRSLFLDPEEDEDDEDEEDYDALLEAFSDLFRGPEEEEGERVPWNQDSSLMGIFQDLLGLVDGDDDLVETEDGEDDDDGLPPIIDFRRYLNPGSDDDPEDL